MIVFACVVAKLAGGLPPHRHLRIHCVTENVEDEQVEFLKAIACVMPTLSCRVNRALGPRIWSMNKEGF